jgi:hypothetical protein
MRLMNEGDKFNIGDIYVMYATYTSLRERSVFMFTVHSDYSYTVGTNIRVKGLYYISKKDYNDDKIVEFSKEDYDRIDTMTVLYLYDNHKSTAYWELTEDETLDILTRVI